MSFNDDDPPWTKATDGSHSYDLLHLVHSEREILAIKGVVMSLIFDLSLFSTPNPNPNPSS